MVKKTKRFKYEAKKSAKEYVVHDEPKPEPAIDNPSMNKKRIITLILQCRAKGYTGAWAGVNTR